MRDGKSVSDCLKQKRIMQSFLQTITVFELKDFLVWVEALHPSQQFFSHVGMEPPVPGYYQYFLGRSMYLAQGYNTLT